MSKKDLIIFNVHGNKKGTIYKYVGWTNGFNQGTTRWFSLGNVESLTKINPNAIEIMKEKLKYFSRDDDKDKIKQALLHSIENQKILKTSRLAGSDLIECLLKKHNIFSSLKVNKDKDLEETFNLLISKRLVNPTSIFNLVSDLQKYSSNDSISKSSFYKLLDILFNSQEELLNSLNKMIENETKRELNDVYFDSTTLLFESFEIDEFSGNQLIIAMACDSNGIPFHFKLFKEVKSTSFTLINFINEIENKYRIKNLTVIADKETITNAGIRFLEQKNHNFIVSYRPIAKSNNFKNWLLDQSNYEKINDSLKYRIKEYLSLHNNKRPNGKTRRKLITWSKLLANKDKQERDILIENFNKKQDKLAFVDSRQFLVSEKCKYFKEVDKSRFELDIEKVKKDQEFDGICVFETNILDLSPEQIIEKYSRQSNIETNFRIFKSFLQTKPLIINLNEHILAHTLLCFASLVILKLITFKINDFYKTNSETKNITESELIELLSQLRERVEINSETKEIMSIEREDSIAINDIWSIYDDIKKNVVKK